MVKKARKISTKWIEQAREYFREFLDETDFPAPNRTGERRPKFKYPEWLIMYIAVLSVKLKIKTYVQIHKMTIEYWDLIAKDFNLKPIKAKGNSGIALKKSAITLENQQRSFFKRFLSWSHDRVIRADKIMNRAKGPIWHKKQKDKGIVSERLRGSDKDSTRCESHADGWVYDHGSFPMTSHRYPVLGCFIWMKNSGNEAKRMWHETANLKGIIDLVSMDSKADSYPLFREFGRQRSMTLVTSSRRKHNKIEGRIEMHRLIKAPRLKQIYKERSYRVEPMQGLVKDIFDLDRCWMRGNSNNRWLFAAMGIAVQMHQLTAFK